MKQSVVDVDRIKKRIEGLQKMESEMDNIIEDLTKNLEWEERRREMVRIRIEELEMLLKFTDTTDVTRAAVAPTPLLPI